MAEVKERLKHGKALCGKVFSKFVETFNWLVEFDSNLCGDGDHGRPGKIKLDRTDEKHPIIRCTGCEASESNKDATKTPFRISKENDEDDNTGEEIEATKIVDGNFYFDGEPQTVEDYTVPSDTLSSGTVYLIGTYDSTNSSWSFEIDDEEPSVTSEKTVCYKLYDFNDGEVDIDYRTTFLALYDKQIRYAQPFDYDEESHSIVNCNFVFDETEKTLNDFTIEPDFTGYVYLAGSPRSDTLVETWDFDLTTSATADSGITYIILYSFTNGKVTRDYRSTFRTFCQKFVTWIKAINSDDSLSGKPIHGVVSFKGNDKSGLKFSNSGQNLELDISGRDSSGDHSSFSIKSIEKKDASGNLEVVSKFLGTKDIELKDTKLKCPDSSNVNFITDIGYDTESGYIRVKQRSATIVVDENLDNIITQIGEESDWIDKIGTTPHDTGD